MKLQCQVEVTNRLNNINTRSKHIKSTLALGKEPKSAEYFIIHFSTSNKSGTKYPVKCISKVFVKFINEGKATLRFEVPPHDLCIKSETIQLKCFMKLLRSCITGETKNLNVAPLSSLAVTHNETPTKLIIRDRSEFPEKGLPRTLECLSISGLNLCNFRREILLLKQLVKLDLSNNAIENIPPEFGRMPNLSELYLSNNQLGVKGEVDWRWLMGSNITKMLKLLDLSVNKLVYLPKSLWKLQNLVTLKLDNNSLVRLPTTIGRMKKLRYLTITNNNLKSLPCGLLQCRLELLDLSENMLDDKSSTPNVPKETPWDFYVGSLVNLASKAVLRYKFYYAPNIIPFTLVEYLDNANMCVCGAPVMNDKFYKSKEFQLQDYFRVVVFNSCGKRTAAFQCYFCSPKCFKKYNNSKTNVLV